MRRGTKAILTAQNQEVGGSFSAHKQRSMSGEWGMCQGAATEYNLGLLLIDEALYFDNLDTSK